MKLEQYTVQKSQDVLRSSSRKLHTHVSRGGLDEINPEDVVYGEYSRDNGKLGAWIDLVCLDNDALRTFSGTLTLGHPMLEELKVLLRDDKKFYVVPIREVTAGIAFKRTDIIDIRVGSLIEATKDHAPSCIWTMFFEDGSRRVIEVEYQSYFAYGLTDRPASMRNVDVLEKIFGKSGVVNI